MSSHQNQRVLVSFITPFMLIVLIVYYQNQQLLSEYGETIVELTPSDRNNQTLYAVFCSNTPQSGSYRGYDYAFSLPLTALAWERIGFRSIVIIVGNRCEWDNDPALSLVLSYLEARNKTTIIFIPSQIKYRPMLSQTARIFAHNLPGFPAKEGDYVISTDADLWPIHREHYTPHPSRQLVLVHGQCCGHFNWNGTSYRMYPMSNIGATVSTWKQIINVNHWV